MTEPSAPRPDPDALPPGETGSGLIRRPTSGSLARPDPAPPYPSSFEEEALLVAYWRVLVRHRWTVITFFLLTVIVATVWTFKTRPVYTANATLRIKREEPRVLKFEEVLKEDPQPDYYQTQYQILQSRTLAKWVIGLLELDTHPEFQQPDREGGWLPTAWALVGARVTGVTSRTPLPAPEGAGDLELESPITRAFQSRLTVEPVRNAQLVRVFFESRYPDLAARVVNALAEAYIAQNLDQKIEATRYASEFVAKQLEDARGKLENSEAELNRFMGANDILFGTPGKIEERQNLLTQQLTNLSTALLQARTERMGKETLVHQARDRDADSLPAVLQSTLIASLKGELGKLEGEYRRLGQTFKPDYPRMQRLQENISQVRRQLENEVRRVVEALDADYRAALGKEQEIQRALGAQQRLVRQLGERMGDYSLLQRQVDTNRELYTTLFTRLKETQISSALFTSNISVVDRAQVPLAPSKPRRAQNLLLAVAVGLLGGVCFAFFFEYLDTNIRDAKEVETVLRVPTLGLVPSRAAVDGQRGRWLGLLNGDGDEESEPFALVTHTAVASSLAETFRTLRLSLLHSALERPPKTLLVTSVQTGEGKTSIATNLAITLAQSGAGEVLLIDGDMRRPHLHKLLEVPLTPGLSALLAGEVELAEALRPTSIPQLSVIPAGRTPLNPGELLASTRLSRVLEVLRGRFAHIVLDAPPLHGMSDAMTLATRVEGVLLVLRQGWVSRDAAGRAVHLLASVRARLLGVVLNDVDGRTSDGQYC